MLKTTTAKQSNTTYLQGIAAHTMGTPAGELSVGNTIIWNHGFKTTVHAITRQTKCFIWIDELETETGKVYLGRKLKKDRIVARPLEELTT
jgi:hypothetical protein